MWKKKSDSEKQEYSKFEVNNTNEAILASKEIEDASDYTLILKILMINLEKSEIIICQEKLKILNIRL